jgi:hypothetical protein
MSYKPEEFLNRNTLIWSLEELADKELQLRLWTGNAVGEIGSFEEAISGTFDDSGLNRLLDKGVPTGLLDDEVYARAVRLAHLTDKVPRLAPVYELIESREMQLVRETAAELLTLLRK